MLRSSCQPWQIPLQARTGARCVPRAKVRLASSVNGGDPHGSTIVEMCPRWQMHFNGETGERAGEGCPAGWRCECVTLGCGTSGGDSSAFKRSLSSAPTYTRPQGPASLRASSKRHPAVVNAQMHDARLPHSLLCPSLLERMRARDF